MGKKMALIAVCFCLFITGFAQADRWPQKVKYVMDVDMDVSTNRFTGKQKISYSNNSPVALTKVFYHLYWNAFQPNSSMDVRSRELGKVLVNTRPDWDGRVTDRIQNLKPEEIGYQKIRSLKMNGVPQKFVYHETILEVLLTKPIAPRSTVIFDMEFDAQVPLQIRRSGRDNPRTGVRYSMSQWYPKMCEYDYEGWHPTPYVAREFYGVWGDYDVNISIDKSYKLGGTGVLTNANEIGWGYDKPGTPLKTLATGKRMWRFSGANIHDFVWAADQEYKHIVKSIAGGPAIHVLYNAPNDDAPTDSAWQVVADAAVKVLPFIERNFGKYFYPQYSFIQGGDGGMEYPMATLVQSANLGTAFHEWMHSWYQMMLGTNESLYAWMDEGFTSYAEDLVTKFYTGESSLQPLKDAVKENPNQKALADRLASMPEDHSGAYASYFSLQKSNFAEPLSQHADHFNTNYGYSVNAYSKGEVFMEQLGYIVGAQVRDNILLEYYKQWRFKHPNANDFMRVAETVSGLQLDWYKMYWINTTKGIDYGIDSLWEADGKANIRLKRIGLMPMPIDLQLTFKNGTTAMHNVPLNLMFGNKPSEQKGSSFSVHEPWRWTHPTYTLSVPGRLTDIIKVEIDPSKRMADTERKNNVLNLTW